jgi:ferric-dicitrate binding protein FerR (iron transport regulator)
MQISLGQMADRESSARINDAAALWVARLDAGTLSAEEEVQLDAWLAADPRRRGAFARARAISIHMARAKDLGPDFSIDSGED